MRYASNRGQSLCGEQKGYQVVPEEEPNGHMYMYDIHVHVHVYYMCTCATWMKDICTLYMYM